MPIRVGRGDLEKQNMCQGKTLRSFSVNPGGYIGFFDPAGNNDVTFSLDDDPKGKRRLAAKGNLQAGRGQRRRNLRSAVD